ncbi:MAG: exonuclease domain-containing protein [Pseudomonadota bacterium]
MSSGLGFRPAADLTLPLTTGPAIKDIDLDFVVVDVETACSRTSSICQIGIVGFAGGREVLTYESLIDPEDRFDAFNTRLHGIGARHVRGKPNYARLHATISAHLGGRVAVAHSNFDRAALGAACAQAGIPAIDARWLDSVRVARHAWPDLPSHKLNVVAAHLGLEHRHHDALSDARVAGWTILKAMDHTGIDLDGWMAGPWRKQVAKSARSPWPMPAENGPLAGERVAFMSRHSDPELPAVVADAGGRIMSGLGETTTLFVVAAARPFTFGICRSANYQKAEALIAAGKPLRILSGDELRALVARDAESFAPSRSATSDPA